MAVAPLATSIHDRPPHQTQPSDPFATPISDHADLPVLPKPVAHPPQSTAWSPYDGYTPSLNYYGCVEDEKMAYPYKSESMSSRGESTTKTGISSIDMANGERRTSNQKSSRRPSIDRRGRLAGHRDPEKGWQSPSCNSRDRTRPSENHRMAYLEDDGVDDARQVQEHKALTILLFLSGPGVILSFLNAAWTLISLVIVTLALPVRICARRPTFGQQLGGLLGPALNLQLKSIYTPLPPHADEDTSYNPGMLLIVQLFSPFLSIGMMLASWVVAIFWLSSLVVGDPSGTDKRDDGREMVLSLRNWWERWLIRSVRED